MAKPIVYKKDIKYNVSYINKNGETKNIEYTPKEDLSIAKIITNIKEENSDYLKLVSIEESKPIKKESLLKEDNKMMYKTQEDFDPTLDLRVKPKFKERFPEEGSFIDQIPEDLTFRKVMDALNNEEDIYDVIGVNDSVVREEIFILLSDLLDIEYDEIYQLWLHGPKKDKANENFTMKKEDINEEDTFEELIPEEDEDVEKMYDVISYYDDKLKGIEDSITSNDWSVITDFAHNKLMNGSYVKIVNTVSGKEKVITPSTYQDEFNGEFTIKPEELTEAVEEIIEPEEVESDTELEGSGEDQTQTQLDVEEAVEEVENPTEEDKLATEVANSSLDVLIADEESAIEGYNGFLTQAKNTLLPPLYEVLEKEINEIIRDEEDHINKLNTIKSAFHIEDIPLDESVELTEGKTLSKDIKLKEIIKNATRQAKIDGYDQYIYKDSDGEYSFTRVEDENRKPVGKIEYEPKPHTVGTTKYIQLESKEIKTEVFDRGNTIFELKLDCSNEDTFDVGEMLSKNVAKELRKVADKLDDTIDQGPIMDINGNKVGSYGFGYEGVMSSLDESKEIKTESVEDKNLANIKACLNQSGIRNPHTVERMAKDVLAILNTYDEDTKDEDGLYYIPAITYAIQDKVERITGKRPELTIESKEVKTESVTDTEFEGIDSLQDLQEVIENLYEQEKIDDDIYDEVSDYISTRIDEVEKYIEERSKVTNTDEKDIVGIMEDNTLDAIERVKEIMDKKLNESIDEELPHETYLNDLLKMTDEFNKSLKGTESDNEILELYTTYGVENMPFNIGAKTDKGYEMVVVPAEGDIIPVAYMNIVDGKAVITDDTDLENHRKELNESNK